MVWLLQHGHGVFLCGAQPQWDRLKSVISPEFVAKRSRLVLGRDNKRSLSDSQRRNSSAYPCIRTSAAPIGRSITWRGQMFRHAR